MFGYDREALWEHYVEYGLNEGRGMNSLIDVVKYREEYPDLDAEFGDNWDAYLTHYLTFGAKEGRDTGTGFNALDYAERYSDLKEAYGSDVLALWKHYLAFGSQEGREARPEKVVVAEKEAAKAAAAAAEAAKAEQEQKPVSSGARTEYEVFEYNEAGALLKSTFYVMKADGSVNYYTVYEYKGGSQISTTYNADGTLREG